MCTKMFQTYTDKTQIFWTWEEKWIITKNEVYMENKVQSKSWFKIGVYACEIHHSQCIVFIVLLSFGVYDVFCVVLLTIPRIVQFQIMTWLVKTVHVRCKSFTSTSQVSL